MCRGEWGRPDISSSLQTLNDQAALGKNILRGFFSQDLGERKPWGQGCSPWQELCSHNPFEASPDVSRFAAWVAAMGVGASRDPMDPGMSRRQQFPMLVSPRDEDTTSIPYLTDPCADTNSISACTEPDIWAPPGPQGYTGGSIGGRGAHSSFQELQAHPVAHTYQCSGD